MTDASCAVSVGRARERWIGECRRYERAAEIADIGTEGGVAARGADTYLFGEHHFGPTPFVSPFGICSISVIGDRASPPYTDDFSNMRRVPRRRRVSFHTEPTCPSTSGFAGL
jgi:hypothetical protein